MKYQVGNDVWDRGEVDCFVDDSALSRKFANDLSTINFDWGILNMSGTVV